MSYYRISRETPTARKQHQCTWCYEPILIGEKYDRERGITYWTKNYRTGIETEDAQALERTYEYYDPIHPLPQAGQDWWTQHAGDTAVHRDLSREIHS